MSDMKCPFCNKKLEPIGTSGQFQCGTWGCDASFNFIATRDVWEYIDRTRKELEQSKTCCSDWEKQALDYKAKNIALSGESELARKVLDKGMEHITGLNNMIESWLNLINSDLDQETKLHILKSAISAYVENKGGGNE